MPRIYIVTGTRDDTVMATRIAGSMAEVKAIKEELMAEPLELSKKEIEHEEAEMPSGKGELIPWLNEILAGYDAGPEEEGEED